MQQVVPAADVLAALRPDEAFAAITLTPHGGWSFLLRTGAIDAAPVKGDAATITALVKRVRASIEVPTGVPPKFDTTAAQALYDATLAPVGARLGGVKALVVAPSGALLSLPFAVLLTGPGDPNNLADAPWLIRQMTIAHVPSAANFVALRKAGGSRAAHPWFGFGGFRPVTLAQADATFAGAVCADSARLFASLPPLAYAQRELDAARGILGARPSDELLNAAFTADAVRHTTLKDFRILHFATHALLPARSALPERAGHRHVGSAERARRVRHAADRERRRRPRSRRQPRDSVGLQLRRAGQQHAAAKACPVLRARSSSPALARCW